MAERTATIAYDRPGVAKYNRRSVIKPWGEAMPTIPTTMLNSAMGNAAILMSFFIRSSSRKAQEY